MTTKAVLYSFFRSSATWRVRIALAMKDVSYEYRAMHLFKGDQLSEEYGKFNPMGQIPCLLIDDLTLTQSLPIIEYLDETRANADGTRILRGSPAVRFHARQIAEIINSGTQPLQNISVMKRLAKQADKAFVEQWGKDVITYGLNSVETILKKTSGTYAVGDQVSLADLAITPQMFNALAYKVEMDRFPLVRKVIRNVYMLEPFQAADPKNQPDCPEDQKNWNTLL